MKMIITESQFREIQADELYSMPKHYFAKNEYPHLQKLGSDFVDGVVEKIENDAIRPAEKYNNKDVGFPYKVYSNGVDLFFLVVYDESGTKIGFMVETEMMGGNMVIRNTGAVPEFRGKGMGMKVYESLPTIFGVPLISGANHTPNSKKLWRKLVDKYPDRTVAYSKMIGDIPIEIRNGDIYYITKEGSFPIYGDSPLHGIIRLKFK